MHKLLEAAGIAPQDWVLEVGCGAGSLTALLARAARRVIVAEIDVAMLSIARSHLAAAGNVHFIEGDVLRNKSTIAPAVVDAMAEARAGGGIGMLVANLPYDVATSLVANLIVGGFGIERLCFTVQAEVADRFLARVGTSDYGPVSILAQTWTRAERIARVPPEAFWPRPRVQSAMLRLDRRPAGETPPIDPAAFTGFLRTVFQARRKSMRHILTRMPAAEPRLARLEALGLSSSVRPQDVSVVAWHALFAAAT